MVDRGKLQKLLDERLPHDLAAMISVFLTPLTISTVGDPTNLSATIFRGVVQGSPLSPLLFNVYIDKLAIRLEIATSPHSSQLPRRLYADDVLLHLATIPLLKMELKECDQWAEENAMQWEISKCKVLIPQECAGEANSIRLAGEQIPLAIRAEYLGVDIDGAGVRKERSISRTGLAIRSMRAMEAQGLLSHGMRPRTLIRAYKCLIRPLSEHALALVPLSTEMKKALNKVDQYFFAMLLKRKRVTFGNLKTLRALFRLDGPNHRHKTLQHQLIVGLKSLKTTADSNVSIPSATARIQANLTLDALKVSHANKPEPQTAPNSQ